MQLFKLFMYLVFQAVNVRCSCTQLINEKIFQRVSGYQVVPLTYQSTVDVHNIFSLASHILETMTNFKFREVRESDFTLVNVGHNTDKGCFTIISGSHFAMEIQLRDHCCSLSSVVHELFHVFGFQHEHDRPDRNKYFKTEALKYQCNPLTVEYDLSSITHYSYPALKIYSKFEKIASGNFDFVGNHVFPSPYDLDGLFVFFPGSNCNYSEDYTYEDLKKYDTINVIPIRSCFSHEKYKIEHDQAKDKKFGFSKWITTLNTDLFEDSSNKTLEHHYNAIKKRFKRHLTLNDQYFLSDYISKFITGCEANKSPQVQDWCKGDSIQTLMNMLNAY